MNATPTKKGEPPKKADFERSLQRLEEVVKRLESANLPLDDAIQVRAARKAESSAGSPVSMNLHDHKLAGRNERADHFNRLLKRHVDAKYVHRLDGRVEY